MNILALGAQTKSNFSVLSNGNLYTSEPLNNISELNNFCEYEKQVNDYLTGNNIKPDYIVCDTHPDYLSTQLAEKLHSIYKNSKILRMQHHFAHIIACMHENNINENVLGISFDGTGHGDDGNSWGSEFMLCNRKSFKRLCHLKYMHLPGADLVVKQPWRIAVSYIYDAYKDEMDALDLPLLKRIDQNKIGLIKQMIDKNINSPLSSSMGRLFDAVASITGICDECSFEAQAAIALEKKTVSFINGFYNYRIHNMSIIVDDMIKDIIADMENHVSVNIISTRFHNTIVEIIIDIAKKVQNEHNINKLVISGGCFLNNYLVKRLNNKLLTTDIELYKHNKFPASDLGISMGQAIFAKGVV